MMSNPVLITVCTHIKTACTLGQLWIRLWKFCTLYRQQLPNAWGVSKGGTTVFHSHQQHLRVSDFSTSAHPIIAEGSSVFQWLWFAFPWLLKTLSTFLCAYWLSVGFSGESLQIVLVFGMHVGAHAQVCVQARGWHLWCLYFIGVGFPAQSRAWQFD